MWSESARYCRTKRLGSDADIYPSTTPLEPPGKTMDAVSRPRPEQMTVESYFHSEPVAVRGTSVSLEPAQPQANIDATPPHLFEPAHCAEPAHCEQPRMEHRRSRVQSVDVERHQRWPRRPCRRPRRCVLPPPRKLHSHLVVCIATVSVATFCPRSSSSFGFLLRISSSLLCSAGVNKQG